MYCPVPLYLKLLLLSQMACSDSMSTWFGSEVESRPYLIICFCCSYWYTYRYISRLDIHIRVRMQVYQWPNRPFHSFRALKSVDQQFWATQIAMIPGFWASKIVKISVGWLAHGQDARGGSECKFMRRRFGGRSRLMPSALSTTFHCQTKKMRQ